MKTGQVRSLLRDTYGIDIKERTLYRKIVLYLPYSTRSDMNGYWDIREGEVRELALCLALEGKGKTFKEVQGLVKGLIPKSSIVESLNNSSKVDGFLRAWVEAE